MAGDSDKHQKETVTSICGICPGGCGVNVELVEGKIEKIFPLKDHPVGVVCVRLFE
jgi:anaerobic selenocysteine-containing dehydrogenase